MLIFGSSFYKRPDDYDDIPLTHDDPVVLTIAKTLLRVEYPDYKPNAWDYHQDGATQDMEYYAEPYRRKIAETIETAVAIRDALATNGPMVPGIPQDWRLDEMNWFEYDGEYGESYSEGYVAVLEGPTGERVEGIALEWPDAIGEAARKADAA